jgi:hypothetical protein
MPDLYSLLKQFNAIGGMAQTGQSGFCLLMALWQKSNELNWISQFTMTNPELLYRAGFNSEKHLWEVRNRLDQMGYFEYIKPPNRKKPGTYNLNFNLYAIMGKLPNYLPQVNSQTRSEVNSQVSSEVNSGTHINKLNIPTEQNQDANATLTKDRACAEDDFFDFLQQTEIDLYKRHVGNFQDVQNRYKGPV